MIKYWLKFTDRAEAVLVLGGYYDNESNQFISDYDMTIYDAGTLYKATGNVLDDGEGNSYPEMAAVEGYHVNVLTRSEKPYLDEYNASPSTPAFTWGD
jgi:hypothetical protein